MHVLLLGARAEPIAALADAGHEVTLLYRPAELRRAPEVPVLAARSAAVHSYADVDGLARALDGLIPAGRPVEAVATVREVAVLPAAYLGARLGVGALAPDVAVLCRDKPRQKAAWRRAGIRTADWTVLANPADPTAAQAVSGAMPGPYIVKRLADAGGRGVRPAADAAELRNVLGQLATAGPGARSLMVERRNPGDEWHFDGVVRGGRVVRMLVSTYLNPLIENLAGGCTASAAYARAADGALYAEADELARRATAALGLTDGVFHFELFGGPGCFVAGELAARPGGGWIRRVVRLMTGVDLDAEAVRAITGDPVVLGPAEDGVHGWAHLPTRAGRPNLLRPERLAMPGVLEYEPRFGYGEIMPDMRESTGVHLGRVLVRAETHARCTALLRRVIEEADLANGGSE